MMEPSGKKKPRPVSQQMAPEEYFLPEKPIIRDELKRRSLKHDQIPEKHLPEYNPPSPTSTQQFPPDDALLLGQPIPNDELMQNPTRHNPLPQKTVSDHNARTKPTEQFAPSDHPLPSPTTNSLPEQQPELPSPRDSVLLGKPVQMTKPGKKLFGHSNGDLPHDQLIPLDELHPEERPITPEEPIKPTVVDQQPLLRPPKKRKPKSRKEGEYDRKTALICGILLIIIGILEIILNTLGILFQHFLRDSPWNNVFFIAPGFWCSVFFILDGIFGVITSRNESPALIMTRLITAPLAIVFGLLLLSMCAWGIHVEVALRETHLASLIVICLMGFICLFVLPLGIIGTVISGRYVRHSLRKADKAGC